MPKSKPADAQIRRFSVQLRERFRDYYRQQGYSMPVPDIGVQNGSKYAKLFVIRNDGSESQYVFAFVNRTTGEIFKPAGWSAPAKHARGNVNSDDGGFEAITPAPGMPSVQYLR